MSYGVFISYKHTHKDRAGRIYDYFKYKGLNPFMDEESLKASEEYDGILADEIKECPYYVCVLSRDGLDELLHSEDSYFAKEVKLAISLEKRMLIILCDGIKNTDLSGLPKEVSKLKKFHSYSFAEENNVRFQTQMDKIYGDIDVSLIKKVIDWREYISFNSNTYVGPRSILEKNAASFENRFGKELVECVKNKKEYHGEYVIKEINMSCYAASLLIAPEKTMIDRLAYDYGTMFNIIAALLNDPDFSMRLITTAPYCNASIDAVEYDKLGNSAFEDNPQKVFLSSYAWLSELAELEPYKTAIESKRFQHSLTDCALPYAIFQVKYKEKYQYLNHIKVDLYSFGLDSSTERRSMLFFEYDPNDNVNYEFFSSQFKQLLKISRKQTPKLIEKNHEKWIKKWNEISNPSKNKSDKKEKKGKKSHGKKNNKKKAD